MTAREFNLSHFLCGHCEWVDWLHVLSPERHAGVYYILWLTIATNICHTNKLTENRVDATDKHASTRNSAQPDATQIKPF